MSNQKRTQGELRRQRSVCRREAALMTHRVNNCDYSSLMKGPGTSIDYQFKLTNNFPRVKAQQRSNNSPESLRDVGVFVIKGDNHAQEPLEPLRPEKKSKNNHVDGNNRLFNLIRLRYFCGASH